MGPNVDIYIHIISLCFFYVFTQKTAQELNSDFGFGAENYELFYRREVFGIAGDFNV